MEKYINFFNNLKIYLEKENGKLWNHQLYGPILFVNPISRKIIANEIDSNNFLTKNSIINNKEKHNYNKNKNNIDIYTGILPEKINIANTVLEWNGKKWAMIMLPLPENHNEQLNLIIHELFHRIQSEIGFNNLKYISCDHLDKMKGRIYLKLELEALKKALITNNKNEQKNHIKNALIFRNYRYQIFSDAKEKENQLELIEGLAEYTGSILSDRNEKELKNHYIKNVENFYNNSTFVRSFAYHTIPIYGYFMYQKDKTWNLKISEKSNLTDYIIKFFGFSISDNLENYVLKIKDEYNYFKINDFETNRDRKQKELLIKFDKLYENNPVMIIPLKNINISFNPGNLIPYRNSGTIYLNLKIIDNFGILTAEKGALINKKWDKVIVSKPEKIKEKTIEGDGWKLELNNNWEIIKMDENYTLKEK